MYSHYLPGKNYLSGLLDSYDIYIYLFHIIEKLNERKPDKIRFYLSKADTAGHESDRQVNVQIMN